MEYLKLKKSKMRVAFKFKAVEKERNALREELNKRDVAFEKLKNNLNTLLDKLKVVKKGDQRRRGEV